MTTGYSFQQRRGTSAQWAAKDPILLDGELGIDKTTGVVKIGDGITKWSLLGSFMGSQYLPLLGKAADSDKLDGLDSTAFLRSNAKAVDSDLLDGLDSTAFLRSTAKAADSDKLDGLDSTAFGLASDLDARTLQASATRKLASYFGIGTSFPLIGVLGGDTFTRSDIGTNGSTWVYVGGTSGKNGWVHKGPIVCTSATRPSTSTIAYIGLEIFETDTNRLYIYNGFNSTTGLLGPWQYVSGGSPPILKATMEAGWYHWNDVKGGGVENMYLSYEGGAIHFRGLFGNTTAYGPATARFCNLPVELAPQNDALRTVYPSGTSYPITRVDVWPATDPTNPNRITIMPSAQHVANTAYVADFSWPIKNYL